MSRKSEQLTASAWKPLPGALAAVGVAGSIIAYLSGGIVYHNSSFWRIASYISAGELTALVLLSALVVIFLAYVRAQFYFSSGWLMSTVALFFIILLVKFSISVRNFDSVGALSFGLSDQKVVIAWSALLISLLYIAAFTLLYLFFSGRLLTPALHKRLITTVDGKFILAMAVFIGVTILRVLLFKLPGLSGSTASHYLTAVFRTDNLVLSSMLFATIISAVEAFSRVRRSEDLKPFYMIGVALLLFFHIWWGLFIYRGAL